MTKETGKLKQKKGFVAHRPDYRVEIKYSNEAVKKNLVRFVLKDGKKSFEISVKEIIDIVVPNFKNDVIAPMLVDSKGINVMEVSRTIKFVPDQDIKAGTEVNLDYRHMYPIEFAIIEEAYNLCRINDKTQVVHLSEDDWKAAMDSVTKKQEEFVALNNKALLEKLNNTNEDVKVTSEQALEGAVKSPFTNSE